jgi:photosystem II stability/assembly factor-like uncharacterized protein
MKNAFTILLVFISISVTAQWIPIRHDSDYMFSEVYFINEDTGFVVGEPSLSSLDQLVLRTHDGGVTWDTTFFSFLYGMTGLSFPTPLVGYTGGRDCDLIKTIDGGNTWNSCPSFPVSFDDLFDLYFINADTGFTLDVGGVIWRTNDGATTWNVVYTPGQWFNQLGFPNEGNMQFLNDTLAYAALGENGLIVKTIDGGATWTDVSVGDTTIHVNAIYMINADTGVAVGRNGKFTRTINGGTTWSPVAQIGNSYCDLMDITFFNDSVGFAIGGNDYYSWPQASNDFGLIYETSDGGITWALNDSLNRHWLTAMHKVNDTVGYCVGFDGRILKISGQGLLLGTHEPAKTEYVVYPNPTSGVLNIDNRSSENGIFILYDNLGRPVREITIEQSSTIDVSTLPNGIYFWNVISEGKKQSSGKIIKQE